MARTKMHRECIMMMINRMEPRVEREPREEPAAKRLSVSLSASEYRALTQLAAADRRSQAGLMRVALAQFIARQIPKLAAEEETRRAS